MTSGKLTASGGVTPHLQHVPAGVKINAAQWLNMMDDVIVPTLAAERGPRWVLMMDKAHSRKVSNALVVQDHVARAKPNT